MSKRVADKEINQDNWDENDESEEAGIFKKASEDVLKQRVLKTARRRTNVAEAGTKSIFSGFSFTNKKSDEELNNKVPTLTFSSDTKLLGSKESSDQTLDTKEKCARDNEFFVQIKSLNQSVAKWIKEHVDSDPICLLTPIFRDYEKHLREIQEKFEKRKESQSVNSEDTSKTLKSTPLTQLPTSETINSPFSFKPAETHTPDKNSSPIKSSIDKSENVSKPSEELNQKSIFGSGSATFSFGKSSTSLPTSLPTAGFSFGTGTPFTFGNVSNPASAPASSNEKEEDPDDDEPPKPEFKAVIEEDSIYTVRCKVFLKKEDNYVDGGVGNLFLKPVKDRNKTQLIVRADTSLGNLLLNVLLSDSIPTKRMGKNNVMMVCIPTPEKATPTSILLRVKTSEQADELLDMIDKYKC